MMTDIDKINEELRNYKLFKIQRINTREQEFKELKNDLSRIQKNEVINYIVCTVNIISILLLIYYIIKSALDFNFLELNKDIIIVNFIVCICLSLFLTYKFIINSTKLKRHIKATESAVQYFANESEKLKSIYENYVDTNLENQKRNK